MLLIIHTIYKTILDSIFPLSSMEKELYSLKPDNAYNLLPHISDFSGIAVPLQNIRSVFTYADERVQKLIWNIKYKKSTHALDIGGYALFQAIKHIILENTSQKYPSFIIIPIPISIQRRKERGYNQCELLLEKIEHIYKKQNPETDLHILFENNLLVRTQHTDRQTLKKRSERLENTQGLFTLNTAVLYHIENTVFSNMILHADIVHDSNQTIPTLNKPPTSNQSLDSNKSKEHIHIIIIDDVITTGSTMYEATQTLHDAGFIHITPLSLAH